MTTQNFRHLLKMSLRYGFLVLSIFVFAGVVNGQNPRAESNRQSETSSNQLVGRWLSDEETVDIRSDGTIAINGEIYRYRVAGNIIKIFDESGSMDFPFQLKGDRMIVQADGMTKIYTRVSGEREPADNRKSGTDREMRSGILPELVGKWCYLSNVNGGGNSRMSNRCFTLYEDGTYEFFGETSSSGSYGSSVTSESDSGRWSATAATIIAYSEKQGKLTLSYEKRNHPKTGDPMIVLEGEAFVTAFQKDPW